MRHAHQSSICHPAPTEALLINSCAEKQLQSQQGKCRHQSLILGKCMLLSYSRSTSLQTFVLFIMPMPLNVKGTLPHTSLSVGLRKDKPDTQLRWPFRINSDLTQELAPSLRVKIPTTGLSLFFQHYQDMLINT